MNEKIDMHILVWQACHTKMCMLFFSFIPQWNEKINNQFLNGIENSDFSAVVLIAGLLQRLEEETRANSYIVKERLPKDIEARKKAVHDLQRVVAEPAMGQSDLDELQNKVYKLAYFYCEQFFHIADSRQFFIKLKVSLFSCYRNDRKFSDGQVWANSVGQCTPGLQKTDFLLVQTDFQFVKLIQFA